MKVSITGSRSLTLKQFNLVFPYYYSLKWDKVNTYFSGGAKQGFDYYVEQYLKDCNLLHKLKKYEPDWYNLEVENKLIRYDKNGKPYNFLAALQRNTYLVQNCDILLACLDKNSKTGGTKDTIGKALYSNTPIELAIIDGCNITFYDSNDEIKKLFKIVPYS